MKKIEINIIMWTKCSTFNSSITWSHAGSHFALTDEELALDLIGGILGNLKFFLNDIQEKSILKKFIELEELLLLDEMIKEYPGTRLEKLRIGIYYETIQLIKMHNEDCIHTILHF